MSVVVVIVVVAGVAGCARSARLPQLKTTPAGADSLQPSMPTWTKGMTPTPGRELSSADALTSMPWQLTSIADDRRSITVVFIAGDGDCVKHVGYHFSRDGDMVTLGEYSRVGGGHACADMVARGFETLTLPVALDGSVALIHSPVAGNWSIQEKNLQ